MRKKRTRGNRAQSRETTGETDTKKETNNLTCFTDVGALFSLDAGHQDEVPYR
jgi:hypothetical protein